MIRFVFLLSIAMLSGCSDPLDDEPKGQTIPTKSEFATRFAAGSGPGTQPSFSSQMTSGAIGGAGGEMPMLDQGGGQAGEGSPAGGSGGQAQQTGLVSGAQGGGGASTAGALPPAGLQGASGGGAQGDGQSGASGQGGTSGSGSGGGG